MQAESSCHWLLIYLQVGRGWEHDRTTQSTLVLGGSVSFFVVVAVLEEQQLEPGH
jgi:hypothetical protein